MKPTSFAVTFALVGSFGSVGWLVAFKSGGMANHEAAWLAFLLFGMTAALATAIYAAEQWYKSVILSSDRAFLGLAGSRPVPDFHPSESVRQLP